LRNYFGGRTHENAPGSYPSVTVVQIITVVLDRRMAEIINLKKQRKARDRAQDTAEAAANRVRHGMTKAEREQVRQQAEQQRQRLDALRLDPS